MMYAVMICLDGQDDWIYVTETGAHNSYDLEVKIFATEQQAERHADVWRVTGKEHQVRVVEYATATA